MIGSRVIACGLNTGAHKEMLLRVSNPVFNGMSVQSLMTRDGLGSRLDPGILSQTFDISPSNFLQLNHLTWWHAMLYVAGLAPVSRFSSSMHYGCSFPSCTYPDRYTQRFTDQDVGFYADHWNKLFEDITKRAGRLAPGSFPVLLPA